MLILIKFLLIEILIWVKFVGNVIVYKPSDYELLRAIRVAAPEYYDKAMENVLKKRVK